MIKPRHIIARDYCCSTVLMSNEFNKNCCNKTDWHSRIIRLLCKKNIYGQLIALSANKDQLVPIKKPV